MSKTADRNRLSSFERVGLEGGALVTRKNEAYGDSFGKSGEILAILYPDGVKPEQMTDMLTIVRMVDKMFRIATDRDALGEDPFRDLLGYSILAVERNDRLREQQDGS